MNCFLKQDLYYNSKGSEDYILLEKKSLQLYLENQLRLFLQVPLQAHLMVIQPFYYALTVTVLNTASSSSTL